MDADGSMTLAFELDALRALADPGAVFTDARGWTEYVGVVSEQPTYVVTNYTRKHRVRQDFFSGPRGVRESLERVREQFETDRHVFVGTTDDDRAVADEAGWEYLDVGAAADAADWALGADGDEPDPFAGAEREDWP
jgi:hypothetical protein